MAQQGGQPKLFLDQRRNLYFYHDPRTDEYVYSDGSKIPVPRSSSTTTATTPRTPSVAAGGNEPPPGPLYRYSGSPPRDAVYTTGERGRLPTPQAPAAQQAVAGLDAAMRNMNIGQSSQRTYDRGGIQIIEAQNPQSRVRTTFGTSPASRITDPTLYNAGVRAHRMLYGTGEGETEQLYSNFRTRRRDFFSFGRVFLVLWVEPAGESGSVVTNVVPSDQAISTGAFNERVFSKVRRFVVIREGATYCSALPIATYGQRGVSKSGVAKSEHTIIHTSRDAPQPRTHELPQRGEAGMRPIPIRVTPDEPTEALDPMSRLDFGKVHTIQHNIKVRAFGNVHQNSKSALYTQFQNVWTKTATVVPSLEEQPSQASASSAGPRAKAPHSIMSGGSKRRETNAKTLVEESDESESEVEEGDDDDDDDDDDDEAEQEEASSSRRSNRGRASSSQPRQSRSGRDASSTQPQQRAVASSSGTGQNTWSAQAQWARNAFAKLTQEQDYSREQAFEWLVSSIMKSQGKSRKAADTEVRALLSGSEPPR